MKPTDEAKRLSYEIADEYLPDVNILGVDGPNTGLADEIINKVLDAAEEGIMDEAENINIATTRGEALYDGALRSIRAVRKLRP